MGTQESNVIHRPSAQHPTAAASAALLSLAGVLYGQTLRAPDAPAEQPADVNLDGKLALGFTFDWTGDKLAVYLVWLAQQPVFEACLCSSPWSTISGRFKIVL